MKKYSILVTNLILVILTFISFSFSKTSTISSCEKLFFSSYKILEGTPKNLHDPNFIEKLPHDFSIYIYLKCSAELAVNDNELAEKFVLDYFSEEIKKMAKKDKLNRHDMDQYFFIDDFLKKIPSIHAFDLGMKYFSNNISVGDIIFIDSNNHIPNTNLGFHVYQQLLLPMMTEDMQKHYVKIYQNVFLEYVSKSENDIDIGDKKFHQLFYPIIKADWEAGKIKLKEKE